MYTHFELLETSIASSTAKPKQLWVWLKEKKTWELWCRIPIHFNCVCIRLWLLFFPFYKLFPLTSWTLKFFFNLKFVFLAVDLDFHLTMWNQ